MRARRDVRNSRISCRLSTTLRLGRFKRIVGCLPVPVSTGTPPSESLAVAWNRDGWRTSGEVHQAQRFDGVAHRLGCDGMSHGYTGAGGDDAESIRTIHRALDLGVTFIDTAEIYGPFVNEELVGRALKGRRDD